MEFSDYHDFDACEKNNDFSDEYSFTRAVFPTKILMDKIELVVAEN